MDNTARMSHRGYFRVLDMARTSLNVFGVNMMTKSG